MLKKLISLFWDVMTYGASGVVSQLAGVLLLPLYTQYLTAADYGVISLLTIANALFAPLANLGLNTAIFRYFSLEKDEERRNKVLGTGLLAVSINTTVLTAVALLLTPLIASRFIGQPLAPWIFELNLIASAVATLGVIPYSVLRAKRRVKLAAGINVIKLLLTIAVTVLTVVHLQMGVIGTVIGTLVAEGVLAIVQLALTLRSYDLRVERALLRDMLKFGLPFVPTRLMQTGFGSFGQYAIAHLLSLDQAGLYNVATKFVAPLSLVVNSIHQAWVPYKYEIFAKDENPAAFFRSVTTYYFAVLGTLWVGVSVWGPEAARLFTAESFDRSAMLVGVVALVPLAQGIRLMMSTGLEMGEDTRQVPLVTALGLVVCVAATYLLVPYLGAAGAALATALGWIAITVAILPISQKRFPIRYDWPALIALMVVAAGLVFIAARMQAWELWPRIGAGVLLTIAYPAAVALIFLRSPTERERMRALINAVRASRRASRAQP